MSYNLPRKDNYRKETSDIKTKNPPVIKTILFIRLLFSNHRRHFLNLALEQEELDTFKILPPMETDRGPQVKVQYKSILYQKMSEQLRYHATTLALTPRKVPSTPNTHTHTHTEDGYNRYLESSAVASHNSKVRTESPWAMTSTLISN